MQESRAERRKKFDPKKWASKHLKSNPFKTRIYGGFGEFKPNVMNNVDRRKLGISQDSSIDDYDKEYEKNLEEKS